MSKPFTAGLLQEAFTQQVYTNYMLDLGIGCLESDRRNLNSQESFAIFEQS